jgi:hypothetical protein
MLFLPDRIADATVVTAIDAVSAASVYVPFRPESTSVQACSLPFETRTL